MDLEKWMAEMESRVKWTERDIKSYSKIMADDYTQKSDLGFHIIKFLFFGFLPLFIYILILLVRG